MLEQPGAHNIGGDLGKDAAFFLSFGGAVGLGVFVGGAVTRPDTVVEAVTCTRSHQTTKDHHRQAEWFLALIIMPFTSGHGLVYFKLILNYSYPEKLQYLTRRRQLCVDQWEM